MGKLEYFTCFWEYSNDRAIELAERLSGLAPIPEAKVFFTSGGTEGDEAAIKMARYYHASHGHPERTWILARNMAYHGIACGTGTVTGFPLYHDGFGPMLPDVHHLTPPYPYRTELYGGEDPVEFCVRELEAAIEQIGPKHIAAMIGEPIMGVAGMVIPPQDYWQRVSEILKRHGILLIFDEVVTAYGRTGKWFGAEHFGVTPDIAVTAKGITSGYAPLGAVLVSREVADGLGGPHGFPMGYTYSGHPTCCAVALANLDIIEREGLVDRARQIGSFLLEQLRGLEDLELVGEVRGIGMMLAVELVRDRATREAVPMEHGVHDAIRRETGVIVRDFASGVVLSPPLVMTEEEATEAADGIRWVLERTRPDGSFVASD
jgi:putrescine aminotransferase